MKWFLGKKDLTPEITIFFLPQVKWFLGKKEIRNRSKYNISNKNQVATLEIYDLTCDDASTYSIVVSNDAGEDEVTFQLIVSKLSSFIAWCVV